MNIYENENDTEQDGRYSYGTLDSERAYDDRYTDASYYQTGDGNRKRGGFFGKLIRAVSLALVIGLTTGASFAGSSYFFGNVLGVYHTKEKKNGQSGGDFSIAKQTKQETGAETESVYKGAVTDVSEIAEQAMPSIVSITTISTTRVRGFFGTTREYENEGCGSGIIVSQDKENLYIATNNHVIAGANQVTVLFSDDTSAEAFVKGTDPSSDLAVVRVPLSAIDADTKKVIRTATFGESKNLTVGQSAIAIGNALGYGQSVTTGVISALDREVSVTDETDGSVITNELIQTDAAINPGNSGGALLNLNGEVIGINSVKYSEKSVEGMGYAIPSSTAIPIIRQLITREVVTGLNAAYFGISGVDVTESVAKTYNMPKGVYIAQVVEKSGADEAGIARGDIITKFDGRNITSMEEIQKLLSYMKAGTEVDVTVQRAVNGEYTEKTFQVTLGSKR